jgi:hypothetical protein
MQRVMAFWHGIKKKLVKQPLNWQRQCRGGYDFYGDHRGDGFVVNGKKLLIKFGNCNTTLIPINNDQYDASVGMWFAGDFKGDGLTHLVHWVEFRVIRTHMCTYIFR